MMEWAKVIKWVLLAGIVVVVVLEFTGYILNWVMGAILVPLIFTFFYFWQLAAKASKNEE